MNVFIAEDINWDNFAPVTKYISDNYLPEDVNISHTYGKQLPFINNICNRNMFRLMRRSINNEDPTKSIYDIIKNSDLCIVFHNFIEYDTLSSFVIDVCEKNNRPCIIVSEHSQRYYLNGEICDTKFKNIIKTIKIKENCEDMLKLDRQFNPPVVTFQPKSIDNAIKRVRHSYEQIEEQRKHKSIAIIEHSEGNCSHNKQIAYIDYMRDKKKWLKEVIPRS
jgi:hypothetical protein